MLESAGFADVTETDVTKQFTITTRAWLEGRRRYYDDLAQAMGEAKLDEMIDDGEKSLEFLNAGLLQRSLLTGRRKR